MFCATVVKYLMNLFGLNGSLEAESGNRLMTQKDISIIDNLKKEERKLYFAFCLSMSA